MSCGVFRQKKRNTKFTELVDSVRLPEQFLERGKRLRQIFCVIGWQIASLGEPSQSVYRMGAGLELFHSFALIHDDIMDDSHIRRGRPTMHRMLSATALAGLSAAQRRRYGLNSAILVGDLALVWSGELLMESLAGQSAALGILDLTSAMREELMVSQLRDIRSTGVSSTNLEAAPDTIRFKTTTYTIDYPLRLDAVLANADERVLSACSAYAVPLGEAFQLRDDLLGLFGDPDHTGKSDTDDLRTGKATVLMALALRTAAPAQRQELYELVGDETIDATSADTLRGILKDTGAVAAVERLILDRRDEAITALDNDAFPVGPREMLRKLATQVTDRTF